MVFVERTCTVVEGGDAQGPAHEAMHPIALSLQAENGTLDWQDVVSGWETTGEPLSRYAQHHAWVLLAPAGAGKTEAFKREAERLGAHYTTARDFVTPTKEQKRAWRNGTIFIDALDEMRAGAMDGRKPLDKIRKRLDDLHSPPFRLSCREADWFGANDRDRLASVAQGGNVLVLRLDPLTDKDVQRLLADRRGVEFAREFIMQADKLGLGSLLSNPQTLALLERAVTGSLPATLGPHRSDHQKRQLVAATWPDSRTKTFELACTQLAEQCYEDHPSGSAVQESSDQLLDAAGRLCAVSLLSDHVGYTLQTVRQAPQDFIPIRSVSRSRNTPGHSQALLTVALRTSLFTSPDGNQCMVPMHRQIAEFLAARYLAQLLKDGLPRQRIMALATGSDGGIVTGLRGLVAWLAALHQKIRSDCIERDPVDTMLYGDVRWFSLDDKRHLVQRIKEQASGDSWLLLLRNRFDLNARWGDLATKDAEPIFREGLTNIRPDNAGQLMAQNMLRALLHGDDKLPLDDLLLDIVRDRKHRHWPQTRSRALEAFVKQRGDGRSATDQIQGLLHEVENGTIDDPFDDFRGTLLAYLYPDHLGPAEVLRYLHEPKRLNWLGSYRLFCRFRLIDSSTASELGELLDGLCEDKGGNVLQTLRNEVLQRQLKQQPDDVRVDRLFKWFSIERKQKTEDALAHWLTANPNKYKELVIEAAKHRTRPIWGTMFWLLDCEPPDFGLWCLNQAMDAQGDALAEHYMEGVHYCLRHGRGCEGLSESLVEGRIHKHPSLARYWYTFERRRRIAQRPENYGADQASMLENQTADWRKPWQSWLRTHEDQMRANCPPEVLRELGELCRGHFDLAGDTPAEHLRDVLQDEALVQLALAAIRDTPRRVDLPSVTEVAMCEQPHPLASPFAAALKLARPPLLDRAGKMLALAFRFHSGELGVWYESVLATQPALVAETLLTYGRAAFKHGNYPAVLTRLAEPDHAAVAKSVTLKLLKAFPPRCKAEHLSQLRFLLTAALRHARDGLGDLVQHKAALSSMTAMQRVCWLCCGLSLDPVKYREPLIDTLTGRREYERILCAIRLMSEGILPIVRLDVQATAALLEHLGTRWPPSSMSAGRGTTNSRFAIVGSVVDAADVSAAVERLIGHLASLSESAATEALKRLAENALLERWQDRLRHALGRQRETRREAEFQYATVAEVLETLNRGNPANSADLAALTTDHLRQLAESIARGNTSDWELFWNLAKGLRRPRDENLCRNALLRLLRPELPKGVNAEREGSYAADRRADIRVSYKGFNVPVEIKKSTHRELWTAIGTQLMEYANDPGADGHGIYLVLWFGPVDCRKSPDGERPETPQQLEEQLQRTLGREEARRIDVVVVDVSDQKRA